jgi:voltage-gated potassium channel
VWPIKLIERRLALFAGGPASLRKAASIIVMATGFVVIAAGVLMRLLDPDEYPNIWRALWWAMQTVTTVGYGDVTPSNTSGRIIAVAVMLWGVAFVAILVASSTSVFVARASRERRFASDQADELEGARSGARFDDLAARLDRMERAALPPHRTVTGPTPRLVPGWTRDGNTGGLAA